MVVLPESGCFGVKGCGLCRTKWPCVCAWRCARRRCAAPLQRCPAHRIITAPVQLLPGSDVSGTQADKLPVHLHSKIKEEKFTLLPFLFVYSHGHLVANASEGEVAVVVLPHRGLELEPQPIPFLRQQLDRLATAETMTLGVFNERQTSRHLCNQNANGQ